MRRSLLVVALSFSLTGCLSGPNYQRPQVAVPPQFKDASSTGEQSLADTTRAALVVSQFTLYGDTRRGRRPSWSAAAPPAVAEPLLEAFTATLRALGAEVETGRFGAHMTIDLVNDGPVTLLLET